ncbi:copper ion binding protein [Senna tora]|uniref:Copper ion binding protein n=1 Tax=Senna tora TaxID=362788 RepID=A0A834TZI3_9FABA|nr:copper ion binding protein [Senna tora]
MLPRFTKLKHLFHSFDSSSSYQLIQRCSVSRTAKGKAKIKAGQTLKRSKITTKKGAEESRGPGGGRGSRERQEREMLYEQCLNAPTPVRYLTPNQRAREAEREKMGLISKDRQREVDMMKRKDSKYKVSETPTIIGTPGLDLITLGLVDEDKLPKYELTVEDGRRLAKEYSRVLMRKHRARQAAETTLLRLKKEAIEALPDHLKEAALVPDLTPFPANRFMATLTPPIEGYIEKVREAAMKSSGNEKIR